MLTHALMHVFIQVNHLEHSLAHGKVCNCEFSYLSPSSLSLHKYLAQGLIYIVATSIHFIIIVVSFGRKNVFVPTTENQNVWCSENVVATSENIGDKTLVWVTPKYTIEVIFVA